MPSLLPYDLSRNSFGKEAAQHTITTLIQSTGRSHLFRHTQKHPLNMHGKRVSFSICISAGACRKDFNELVNLATQHYLFDRNGVIVILCMLQKSWASEESECKACHWIYVLTSIRATVFVSEQSLPLSRNTLIKRVVGKGQRGLVKRRSAPNRLVGGCRRDHGKDRLIRRRYNTKAEN